MPRPDYSSPEAEAILREIRDHARDIRDHSPLFRLRKAVVFIPTIPAKLGALIPKILSLIALLPKLLACDRKARADLASRCAYVGCAKRKHTRFFSKEQWKSMFKRGLGVATLFIALLVLYGKKCDEDCKDDGGEHKDIKFLLQLVVAGSVLLAVAAALFLSRLSFFGSRKAHNAGAPKSDAYTHWDAKNLLPCGRICKVHFTCPCICGCPALQCPCCFPMLKCPTMAVGCEEPCILPPAMRCCHFTFGCLPIICYPLAWLLCCARGETMAKNDNVSKAEKSCPHMDDAVKCDCVSITINVCDPFKPCADFFDDNVNGGDSDGGGDSDDGNGDDGEDNPMGGEDGEATEDSEDETGEAASSESISSHRPSSKKKMVV